MARKPLFSYAVLFSLIAIVAAVPHQSPAQNSSGQPAGGASANASSGGSLLELPGASALPPQPAAAPGPIPSSLPAAAPPATPPALHVTGAPVTAPVAPAPLVNPASPASAVAAPAQASAPSSFMPLAPALTPAGAGPALPASSPAHMDERQIAANAATAKTALDTTTKNPDILFAPLHFDANMSMMYKKSDMNVIIEALAVYDKINHTQKSEVASNEDDLTSLLSSLKKQGDVTVPNAPPPSLPNLYLGSIVYYTPGNWSVWINSKKLTNKINQPGREFYVSRLSDKEIELVWKPVSLQDVPALWQRLTENGSHPLAKITVNEEQGSITLVLRPNQTFLPRTLAIREGLIKSVAGISVASPVGAQDTAATSSSADPSHNGFSRAHP